MTEAERDRYLQQALRHAPDADAAAPPALSAAILREARAAVAPPPARGVRDLLAAAWAAMASPRLAGALASLMVLTLAGVMWWGRPIEPALPVREAPVAAGPRGGSEMSTMPASAPVLAAAPAPVAIATKQAPPEVRAEKAELKRAAPAVRQRGLAEGRPAPPAAAVASSPGMPPAPSAPDERRERADPMRDTPAAPVAPADGAPPPAPSPGSSPTLAAPKPAARVAAPGASLLGAMVSRRDTLGAGATSWDLGDGRVRPVDAAFEAFLAQLDASVASRSALVRKSASDASSAASAADAASAPALNLQRDGHALRTLRITADTLSIETPGGGVQRVPLQPGSGTALAARLAELSR